MVVVVVVVAVAVLAKLFVAGPLAVPAVDVSIYLAHAFHLASVVVVLLFAFARFHKVLFLFNYFCSDHPFAFRFDHSFPLVSVNNFYLLLSHSNPNINVFYGDCLLFSIED